MYDSGLHPVEKKLPNPYSDLPQVYHPEGGLEATSKSISSKVDNHYDAPEAVGAPPVYEADSEAPKTLYIDQNEKEPETANPSKRQILGMRRKTAIIVGIIALLVVVAIAVGVGAGVGTSQNRKVHVPDGSSIGDSNTSSSMTSTASLRPTSSGAAATTTATTTKQNASSTASQPVATSGFEGVAEVKCPSINNTEISTGTSKFEVRCAVHWPNNSPAENNNGTVKAIGSNKLVAYSLEECLQHCVDYNKQNGGADPTENGSGCLAVTYNADLSSSFSKFEQNCFLKDRIGVYDPAANTTESAVLISV